MRGRARASDVGVAEIKNGSARGARRSGAKGSLSSRGHLRHAGRDTYILFTLILLIYLNLFDAIFILMCYLYVQEPSRPPRAREAPP